MQAAALQRKLPSLREIWCRAKCWIADGTQPRPGRGPVNFLRGAGPLVQLLLQPRSQRSAPERSQTARLRLMLARGWQVSRRVVAVFTLWLAIAGPWPPRRL